MKKKNSILKYFKEIKGKIFVFSLLMGMSCIFNIINPIINANLLTSITDFNIKKSLIFSGLLLLVTIIALSLRSLINKVYFICREKILFSIRQDMIKSIMKMNLKESINFPFLKKMI